MHCCQYISCAQSDCVVNSPGFGQESEVLIKAFKEHERRNGVKEGFAHTPADALAFKYYRDVSSPLQSLQKQACSYSSSDLNPSCHVGCKHHLTDCLFAVLLSIVAAFSMLTVGRLIPYSYLLLHAGRGNTEEA